MKIEYDINCLDRTLYITFPSSMRQVQKEDILKLLYEYYYAWHADNDPCMGCEEYMIAKLLKDYEIIKWESIDWEDEDA